MFVAKLQSNILDIIKIALQNNYKTNAQSADN